MVKDGANKKYYVDSTNYSNIASNKLIYPLFAPSSSFNSYYFQPDGIETNLKLF